MTHYETDTAECQAVLEKAAALLEYVKRAAVRLDSWKARASLEDFANFLDDAIANTGSCGVVTLLAEREEDDADAALAETLGMVNWHNRGVL